MRRSAACLRTGPPPSAQCPAVLVAAPHRLASPRPATRAQHGTVVVDHLTRFACAIALRTSAPRPDSVPEHRHVVQIRASSALFGTKIRYSGRSPQSTPKESHTPDARDVGVGSLGDSFHTIATPLTPTQTGTSHKIESIETTCPTDSHSMACLHTRCRANYEDGLDRCACACCFPNNPESRSLLPKLLHADR